MSVINQMLRDLDARGQGDARRQAALAAAGQASPALRPARGRALVRGALAVGVLLIGLAAIAWQVDRLGRMDPGGDEPPVARGTVPPAPPTAAKEPVAPASVAPAPVAQAPVAQAPVAQAPVAQAPVAPAPVASDPVEAPAAVPPAHEPPAREQAPVRHSIERVDAGPPVDRLASARLALAEGDPALALAALGRVAADDAEGEALRGAALQQLGRHAEAEQAYRRALRREPDVGAWWAGLGISLEAEGRASDALQAFREAQGRGPLDPALADYLGERIDALSAGESPR